MRMLSLLKRLLNGFSSCNQDFRDSDGGPFDISATTFAVSCFSGFTVSSSDVDDLDS